MIVISANLEISQLRELLPTVVKLAGVGLDLQVSDLVGSDVATLSKVLPTYVATVWPLSSVPSLMGLERLGTLSVQRRKDLP